MLYSRYYRSRLTEPEKEAYDAVSGGIERRETQIAFPPGAAESLDRIIFAVKYDNPLFFYADYAVSLSCGPHSAVLQISFRKTEAQILEEKGKIEREARAIAAGTEGMAAAEKALYLHDRLVRRCSYGETEGRPSDAHTVAGAFLDNVCVCEGYSMAFKYLADLAGLRCMTVTGEGIHPDGSRGPHVWNLVSIEGKRSHIDVTFDSLMAGRYCSHAYFCVSDRELLADHRIDRRFPVPPCPGGQSFLPVISGTDRLVELMRRESQRGASFSQVRLTRGFSADELIEKIHRRLTVEDYEWYRRLDSYSFANNSRVLSLIWK